MTPRLKVNGVTSLQDARVCAALGVEYLGFEQDPASARYVAPAGSREIIEWVVGPEPVGLFPQRAGADEVLAACRAGGFRMAQLTDAGPDVCRDVEAAGVPVIRTFPVLHDASGEQLVAMLEPFAGAASFVLLDTHGTSLWGGAGESVGWRVLREAAASTPLFLAGSVSAGNAAEALRVRPFAVDVGPSVEEAPGVLDFRVLGELVEALSDDGRAN